MIFYIDVARKIISHWLKKKVEDTNAVFIWKKP